MRPLDPLRCPLDAPALIEASAGTGKTYTIATLYTRLVAEAGRDVRQLLVVTFTEAATAELRERIRSRLFAELDGLSREDPEASPLAAHLLAAPSDERRRSQDRLRAALESFDQAAIFTIHGFCQRLLHENAFECQVDFEAELEKDGGPLFEELLRDFCARETHSMEPLALRLLEGAQEVAKPLRRVLREVTSRPSAELRPRTAPSPDLSPLHEFAERSREVQRAWANARVEVERLLSLPGLDQRTFKSENIPEKMDALDRDLGADTAEMVAKAVLEKPWLSNLSPVTLAKKTNKGGTTPTHPFFDLCGGWEEARQALPRVVEAHRLHLRWRFAEFLRTELPARKRELGILHFDDLLGAVDRALQGEHASALINAARARYHAALIDEFQDTDPVQYRIFSRLFGGAGRPLFLIGDPKQAIYAFRGADIFAYLSAVKEAPSEPLTLNVNWRSDPALLRAVTRLFAPPARPFLLPGIEFPAVEPRPDVQPALSRDGQPVAPLQLRFLSAERREGQSGRATKPNGEAELPRLVAQDIVRLLTGPDRLGPRPILPSDVAVLVRSNRQAQALQAELTALGVPAVSSAEGSVLESDEAGELAQVLAALIDPGDARRVRAALTTRLFGLRASDLARLATDEAAWDAWVSRFREWRELWERRGFVHAHRAVLAHVSEPSGVASSTRMLGAQGGERALTNHLHLAELLHRAAHERHLGPHGLLRWFERARAGDHADKEAAELRLETDDAAVQIVTVHKSKGLEYPVVYCPFLWTPPRGVAKEGVLAFHDPKANDQLVLELRADDPDAQTQTLYERRAEELRLAYVALTRAKHLCVVVTGNFGSLGDSALGYLLHHQPDPDDPWTRTRDFVRGLSEAEQRAALEALAASSDGAVGVSTLAEDRPPRYEPPTVDHGALTAPARARKVTVTRALSSYSGLVQGAPGPEPDERPVLDRGEAEVPPGPEPTEPGTAPALRAPISLAEFPRTAAAGTFFHSVYEVLDFQDPDPNALRQLTAKKLRRFGHDPGRWLDSVSVAIAGTLQTPLEPGPSALRLADLPRAQRLDELPFLLAATAPGRSGDAGGLRAAELAAVFRAYGAPPSSPDYAEALAKLNFPALSGFLKGYIDLVFEHGGRYFVLDYKSNYLGDRFADYTPPRLFEAMSHGHYYLQYHLYVLAVHRYLRLRHKDYDYDRDFGGVYYLFLKGMSPATGADSGVYFDKPARGLIEDLDQLFGATAATKGRPTS